MNAVLAKPTAVKERPILFSTPMVRAILEGRKTQTRRVCKTVNTLPNGKGWTALRMPGDPASCLPLDANGPAMSLYGGQPFKPAPQEWINKFCPYGQPGDRLWVREAFALPGLDTEGREIVCYRASGDPVTNGEPWKPSIFMPRWASRITLEIVSVRVERLQDITEEDAKAEGCYPEFEVNVAQFVRDKHWNAVTASTYKLGYKHLWDSINGKTHPWSSNPWVWRIEFKRL